MNRDDAAIRMELPGTVVPAGRTVLAVTGLAGARWHPVAERLDGRLRGPPSPPCVPRTH